MPEDATQDPTQAATQDAPAAVEAVSDSTTEALPAFSPEKRAVAIGIAGWVIPGLGHAIQKMWGRALIVFFAVGLLVYAGASMRGNVFTSRGNDAFDLLGFVADLGTGVFYFAELERC